MPAPSPTVGGAAAVVVGLGNAAVLGIAATKIVVGEQHDLHTVAENASMIESKNLHSPPLY